MKNNTEFQARMEWLRNLKVGDKVAVRSNNPGTLGELPYHEFRVKALTPTQGVITHTSQRLSGVLPDLKFMREDGCITSNKLRSIEPWTKAVHDANERAFLAYWSRYTVQDEVSRLPVEAQREVYSAIRKHIALQAERAVSESRESEVV